MFGKKPLQFIVCGDGGQPYAMGDGSLPSVSSDVHFIICLDWHKQDRHHSAARTTCGAETRNALPHCPVASREEVTSPARCASSAVRTAPDLLHGT